jgi:hypothetical protein
VFFGIVLHYRPASLLRKGNIYIKHGVILCFESSNGYLLNVIIYTGKTTSLFAEGERKGATEGCKNEAGERAGYT